MNRRLTARMIGLILLSLGASRAQASGDISSCLWGTPDCPLAGTPWLDVSNDTRDNLLRLVSARKGFALPLNALPADDKTSRDAWFGYHPQPWEPGTADTTSEAAPAPDPALKAALLRVAVTAPIPSVHNDELEGRFITNSAQAATDYITALSQDSQIAPSRRQGLAEARLALLAEGGQVPAGHSILKTGIHWPGSAGEFRDYLAAAEAFYQGDYPRAGAQFSKLAQGSQPWVAETARYMIMRTWLNQSTQQASDQYGLFDLQRIHADSAGRALTAAQDYLARYPHGRYSATTRGMLRRLYWLLQRPEDLAPLYQQALDQATTAPALLEAVLETDSKLQNQDNPGGASFTTAKGAPLLNFTQALSWLRPGSQEQNRSQLSSEQALNTLTPLLASQNYPGLADYLHQAWRFWHQHDYQAIVTDITPDYHLPTNDVVGFSRQILYGAALMALDRNEQAEAHWRKLLSGGDGERQQLVQMKLAATLVASDQLPVLLAADSPVTSMRLRSLALKTLASDAQLRNQVHHGRNAQEQTIALHTLLVKDLQAGHYQQWLQDHKLIARLAGNVDARQFADVDLSVFNWDGKNSESGYACPALVSVVTTLAATPRQPKALNCLGEFARMTNVAIDLAAERGGNDAMDAVTAKSADIQPLDRQSAYRQVIANAKASAEDRSFALYRAVRCYAPSGYNDCGGKDVSKAQRKAWFNDLKSHYPDSAWSTRLKYYW